MLIIEMNVIQNDSRRYKFWSHLDLLINFHFFGENEGMWLLYQDVAE